MTCAKPFKLVAITCPKCHHFGMSQQLNPKYIYCMNCNTWFKLEVKKEDNL